MVQLCRAVHFCSIVLVLQLASILPTPIAANFTANFVVSWAPSNVKFLDNGEALQLVLDNATGSGFQSKDSYLFGNIAMQIKLVPGNSAGTVTAYYLSSENENDKHDELDFEFLGNETGQPYVLQTNVFSNGTGGREQRIFLWFDPTEDFHTYSVSWTKQRILFLVDGIPIRAFSNNAVAGVPYLERQPMRIFSSLWNGDSWATRGGQVKIDWSQAPFVATYRNFHTDACIANTTDSIAKCAAAASAAVAVHITDPGATTITSQPIANITNFEHSKLLWVKHHFMVYDYCRDVARYPSPPFECNS